MKIWNGYGSEHSANLVLIGQFATTQNAEETLALLNEATAVAEADEAAGRLKPGEISTQYSDGQLGLFQNRNLAVSPGDPEQLLYEFHPRLEGNRLIITTEETDVNAFVKILLHGGAKIEVYSAHDHGGPYGRGR